MRSAGASSARGNSGKRSGPPPQPVRLSQSLPDESEMEDDAVPPAQRSLPPCAEASQGAASGGDCSQCREFDISNTCSAESMFQCCCVIRQFKAYVLQCAWTNCCLLCAVSSNLLLTSWPCLVSTSFPSSGSAGSQGPAAAAAVSPSAAGSPPPPTPVASVAPRTPSVFAGHGDMAIVQNFSPGLGMQCWFECGTTEHLQNMGNARSPRWVCGPCNGSRRCLDSQARATAASRSALNDLKRNQQSLYKRKVRSARIVPASVDAPGTPGAVTSRGERREALATFTASVSASASVSDIGTILWMDEIEWIAHKKERGADDPTAKAMWDRASVSYPPHCRRGNGKSLRLAVLGIPRTEGVLSRGIKRSLDAIQELEGEEAISAAGRMVSVTALGRAFHDKEFGEVGGDVFRPNSALVGAEADSAVSAAIVPRSAPVADLSVVAPVLAPAEADRAVGRQLRAQLSEPSAPQGKAEQAAKLRTVSAHVCLFMLSLSLLAFPVRTIVLLVVIPHEDVHASQQICLTTESRLAAWSPNTCFVCCFNVTVSSARPQQYENACFQGSNPRESIQ